MIDLISDQIAQGDIKEAAGYAFAFVVSIVGQIGHQLKKWLRDDTSNAGFFSFIMGHPKHTISAFLATITAMLALVQMSIGVPDLITSFFAGFSVDSIFNKSPKQGDYGEGTARPMMMTSAHSEDSRAIYIEPDYEESYVAQNPID